MELEAQGRDSTFTICHALLKKAISHHIKAGGRFVFSTTVSPVTQGELWIISLLLLLWLGAWASQKIGYVLFLFCGIKVTWGQCVLWVPIVKVNTEHSRALLKTWLLFLYKTTYPLVGHRLWKLSRTLIVAPHLSELKFCGHIVTDGKETLVIEWASVSTTVMMGSAAHAVMK